MRILLAEDEVSIARALQVMLERNKYTVDVVCNGLEALDYMGQFSYDALILDIMMPGLDGISVLKQARADGISTPALFLTAKGEVEDRVAGLDAGADDYLPKPFATDEFLARVRALTRRSSTYIHTVLSLGNLCLDANTYALSVGERALPLSNKEYQLMELFLRHPGQVFSTEHLMDRIWGVDSDTGSDVVWTYMGFLRKKLRQLGADIEIRTIRGAGYALEEMSC